MHLITPGPARLSGVARHAMWGGMDTNSVTVNGELRSLAPGATIFSLLAEIGLDLRKVAVERNAEIVPRSTYAETRLAAGDRVEIVHFIGGG